MTGPALARVLATLAPLDLDGAACAGRAPWFDDEIIGETDEQRDARHAAAVALCHRCPVTEQCRRLVVALPQPRGVWAGEVWPVRRARARRTRRPQQAIERPVRPAEAPVSVELRKAG